jgi:hypothetical protein
LQAPSQTGHEFGLSRVQEALGFSRAAPGDPVDLRKLSPLAPPDHREEAGDETGWIEVGFDSPAQDRFTRLQTYASQVNPNTLGDWPAGLLLELSGGCVPGVFSREDLAFDNGPMSSVFFGPERPSRVGDQDFDRR